MCLECDARIEKSIRNLRVTVPFDMKTQEEIRNMSEDEFWEYINRPDPDRIIAPRHFNTKEEWLSFYSDGHEVHEFFRMMREKYGI